jgi:ribosomal protein S18 acetylase RimI-like enzyme
MDMQGRAGCGVTIAHDSWMSGMLGVASYCVKMSASDTSARPLCSQDIRAMLRPHMSDGMFAYVKVPPLAVGSIHSLEEAGFRLVDTNVAFARPSRAMMPPFDGALTGIRLARPEDADAVAHVARTGFRFSRFHLDPAIPDDVACELKAVWAGNFFCGKRGDAMVVCEDKDGVAGFLQLLITPDALVIDLIAVAERARRCGRASAMIAFALRSLEPRPEMRVGTQVANTASMRLYESLGFRASGAQYVMHYHAGKER